MLQERFLQNFNMQKFQNMEHSNSRTFQGLSRAWNFFVKIQALLKDPMNPENSTVLLHSTLFHLRLWNDKPPR